MVASKDKTHMSKTVIFVSSLELKSLLCYFLSYLFRQTVLWPRLTVSFAQGYSTHSFMYSQSIQHESTNTNIWKQIDINNTERTCSKLRNTMNT